MEISAEKTKLMTGSTNGIQREIRVTDRSLEQWNASNTMEQLFQVKAQNLRFSKNERLHKPLLHSSSLKVKTNMER